MSENKKTLQSAIDGYGNAVPLKTTTVKDQQENACEMFDTNFRQMFGEFFQQLNGGIAFADFVDDQTLCYDKPTLKKTNNKYVVGTTPTLFNPNNFTFDVVFPYDFINEPNLQKLYGKLGPVLFDLTQDVYKQHDMEPGDKYIGYKFFDVKMTDDDKVCKITDDGLVVTFFSIGKPYVKVLPSDEKVEQTT